MTNHISGNKKGLKIRLLLDNIRSVHNVGSIFRTAEAFGGVEKIYCVGTTPCPVDRFSRKRKDLAKVALGAEDMIPWEYSSKADDILYENKKSGFKIVALEQSKKSVDYRDTMRRLKSSKILIVIGNEVDGVSGKLLKGSDLIAEIPMAGKKESLNVSVATGIFLFSLR